jgi:sec-independent protein translocase protein TatA
MFGLGTTELIIILVIVVLLFGARRLPELGRTLGAGIRNFQKSVKGREDDEDGGKLGGGDQKELSE